MAGRPSTHRSAVLHDDLLDEHHPPGAHRRLHRHLFTPAAGHEASMPRRYPRFSGFFQDSSERSPEEAKPS